MFKMRGLLLELLHFILELPDPLVGLPEPLLHLGLLGLLLGHIPGVTVLQLHDVVIKTLDLLLQLVLLLDDAFQVSLDTVVLSLPRVSTSPLLKFDIMN